MRPKANGQIPDNSVSTTQSPGATVVVVKALPDSLTSQSSDCDDDSEPKLSYKDRRREAHTHAEQKRRDAIKKGYEALIEVLPTCQQQESLGSSKLSKAAVLQKSVEYVQYLIDHRKSQEENLEKLRKDVMALKIMKANYDHIVRANKSSPVLGDADIPDEIKFRVFQQFMDNLFLSFNNSVSMSNFAELSACVFNWLEEYCKPQMLKQVLQASTQHATSEYQQSMPSIFSSPSQN